MINPTRARQVLPIRENPRILTRYFFTQKIFNKKSEAPSLKVFEAERAGAAAGDRSRVLSERTRWVSERPEEKRAERLSKQFLQTFSFLF